MAAGLDCTGAPPCSFPRFGGPAQLCSGNHPSSTRLPQWCRFFWCAVRSHGANCSSEKDSKDALLSQAWDSFFSAHCILRLCPRAGKALPLSCCLCRAVKRVALLPFGGLGFACLDKREAEKTVLISLVVACAVYGLGSLVPVEWGGVFLAGVLKSWGRFPSFWGYTTWMWSSVHRCRRTIRCSSLFCVALLLWSMQWLRFLRAGILCAELAQCLGGALRRLDMHCAGPGSLVFDALVVGDLHFASSSPAGGRSAGVSLFGERVGRRCPRRFVAPSPSSCRGSCFLRFSFRT